MKIASIQLAAGDRTKEEQIDRARGLIGGLGEVDLILLPELWTSGAFAYERMEADAEPLGGGGRGGGGGGGGTTLAAMKEIVREKRCHFFAGSWVERSEAGLHNTAVFLSPEGEVLKTYRKIHLFGYQSKERDMLVAGKTPAVIETPWESSAWPRATTSAFRSSSARCWTAGRNASSSRPGGPIRDSGTGNYSTAPGPSRTCASSSRATAAGSRGACGTWGTAWLWTLGGKRSRHWTTGKAP